MKNLDMKLDSASIVLFAKKLKELIRIGKARVLLPCATYLLILPITGARKDTPITAREIRATYRIIWEYRPTRWIPYFRL